MDMTPEEYIQYVHKGIQQQGCSMPFIVVLLFVTLAALGGCRTKKTVEQTHTGDTLRTEYIERIVTDTVTVEVEVPAESRERETRDSTSRLETSFARSTASLLWRDGMPWLYHSLENIHQKIEKPVEVQTKEKTRTVYRTRYVSKTKTVAAELPWWKTALMWAGAVETMLVAVFIAVLLYVSNKNIRME